LYVVARLGVTGRGGGDPGIESMLERCRSLSPLPRCLGFGIDPETPLERYRGLAEGVVVGSALLEAMLGARDASGRERLLRTLARGFREKLGGLGPA
ncbi:MAG: tryptophan synthase subunit alpha, partial [Candidatus Latescibacteria bacterium]|nr:tryptophan synthase subunit alpha [Candidatus Latescibacterota bacterium]